jgi:hypothetical protein
MLRRQGGPPQDQRAARRWLAPGRLWRPSLARCSLEQRDKGLLMEDREPISWNEPHGGLFQPDLVLPTQFFRTLRGREAQGGERRLIIAVLEDAINCFQKNLFARDNRSRRLFREAENWVMSADRDLPFAFESICEFLSLDAEYIRQGLRRWACAAASQAARHFDAEFGTQRAGSAPVVASATRPGMAPAVEPTHTSFKRPPRNGAAL